MRILFLYLPLPIFWALFDQQGSRWTLQATKMDGNLFGFYRLKPDQIQVVNPLLIIVFIPIFEYGVYPLFAKFNVLKKPLQRIVTGGTLAAIAFIICGFFQLSIEADLPTQLESGSTHLTLVNGLPTDIKIEGSSLNSLIGREISRFDLLIEENTKINGLENFNIEIKVNESIGKCDPSVTYKVYLSGSINESTSVLFITEKICETHNSIDVFNFGNLLRKPEEGGAYIGVVFNMGELKLNSSSHFLFKNKEFEKRLSPTVLENNGIGFLKYQELDVHIGGPYKLSLIGPNETIAGELDLKQGGSYFLVVNNQSNKMTAVIHQLVKHNSISMLWQIIQYSVITAGEIMFSITGLEFSYSQSPKSMKSVLQAAWLLTVAFGNVIVVIIAALRISKQSLEFFLFGGLMIADMIVFAIMAYFYIPYVPQEVTIKIDNDSNQE